MPTAADLRPLVLLLALFACLPGKFLMSDAVAHSQSSSYLFLDTSQAQISLSIDLAVIDLLQVIDLDRNANGRLTWGELTSSGDAVMHFVTSGIGIASGGAPCRLDASKPGFSLVEYADIRYLRINLAAQCPAGDIPERYLLRYGLFFDINPAHRALVHVASLQSESAHVLSSSDTELRFSASQSTLSASRSFLREGVRHILSGYDHLVFLLLLILPAAGNGTLRTKLLRVAVIVTAFTVAHSMTLAAAATGLISLPARPIEIAIAASIVLAAVINIVRPFHRSSWRIAFAFGLVHGFGFAGALQEMGLGRGSLLVSLLAFNIGVEIGQLLVVAIVVPVLAAMSASAQYWIILVRALSFAGAALGVVWTAARF